MSYRDEEKCATENPKHISKSTVRERLERRRNSILETLKYNQRELEEIEDGLKMLNKHKELETLINISQL